jgi:hypothetical protein
MRQGEKSIGRTRKNGSLVGAGKFSSFFFVVRRSFSTSCLRVVVRK